MLAFTDDTQKKNATRPTAEQQDKAHELQMQVAKRQMKIKSQQTQPDSEAFLLDDQQDAPEFHLESPSTEATENNSAIQAELFLPENNPEAAPDEQQLELNGLAKPIYALQVEGSDKALEFHYANNLLESLEAQSVQVPYQCREGYCGGCRTELLQGEVAYLSEPMAWINEGEILPCCCVPKTALKLKLKG
jgi:ferredoxin